MFYYFLGVFAGACFTAGVMMAMRERGIIMRKDIVIRLPHPRWNETSAKD